MEETKTELPFKRSLVDEIKLDEPFENTVKMKTMTAVFKGFKSSEVEGGTITTPLTAERPFTMEERLNNWRFTDFFETKRTLSSTADANRKCELKRPLSTITINRALEKGCPYIMYSTDGQKYYIRKDKNTDGTDSVARVYREKEPQKISLYKNTAHFLDSNSLDIVECTTMSKYQIKIPNAIDMVVPEKGSAIISVLREMEETKARANKKMYLERVDMSAGKIDNYILECNSSQHKFKRVANTWHPMQYIAMSAESAAVIDVREKKSNVFWSIAAVTGTLKLHKFRPYYKVEKGSESKIYITKGHLLGAFDMRNLMTPFGIHATPVQTGLMSLSNNIAIYNIKGQFYYQSTRDPADSIVKTYEFNSQYPFLGFDWAGKSMKSPYSIAAFLFANKISIYTDGGILQEHGVSCKTIPRISSSENRIISTLVKSAKSMSAFVNKSVTGISKTEENPQVTLLERSLQDGFRDPLLPRDMSGIASEPVEEVKKVIPYTRIMDFLLISDKASLLKQKKDQK